MVQVCLCQDCLRVVTMPLSDYVKTAGESACQCGGDVCNCDSCISEIKHLMRGEYQALSLRPGVVVFAWSPDHGASFSSVAVSVTPPLTAPGCSPETFQC